MDSLQSALPAAADNRQPRKAYIGACDCEGRPIAWGRWSRVELGLAKLCFLQSISHLGRTLYYAGLHVASRLRWRPLGTQPQLSGGSCLPPSNTSQTEAVKR